MKNLLNSFSFSNSLKSLFGKKKVEIKAPVKPVDLPEQHRREAMLDEMIREAIMVRPAPKLPPRRTSANTANTAGKHQNVVNKGTLSSRE